MSRHALRVTILLGALITLLGGTGIFAVFSDRATTAANDVSSGPLGHAADLQIASADFGDPDGDTIFRVVCGTFQEDLATGFYSLSDLQPGNDEYASMVCLRNVGSASLDLTMSAIDVVDADVACTGDEAAYGDATCGELAGAAQEGELSPLIRVAVIVLDCVATTYVSDTAATLASLAQTPLAIAAGASVELAPGETACYSLRLRYPEPASPTDVQIAQSDRVDWRFAFDGTVPTN